MSADNAAPGVPPRTVAEVVDQGAVSSASSSVTGMAIFVASEAVFFAAFLGIYMSSYTSARDWPPPGMSPPSLPVPTAAVAVLLLSGLSMTRSLRAVHRADYPRGVVPWLCVTLVASTAFAALVAYGMTDVAFGIGDGIYQSLFYVISGLELAHGAGGVVLLGMLLVRARTGELHLHRDPIQAAAIYWYFVIVLGVVIYVVLDLAVQ